MEQKVYDYVIIGSGFGGSVSAMRLTEKGYSVLVLEKGNRFDDQDFAQNQLAVLEIFVDAGPALPWHPADQLSQGRHGAARRRRGRRQPGLRQCARDPDQRDLCHPSLEHTRPWGEVLDPHYATARKMLGVARNPKLWKADEILRQMAEETGHG